MLRWLVLALSCLVVPASSLSQTDVPKEVKKQSVQGRVIEAKSGQPIRKVNVDRWGGTILRTPFGDDKRRWHIRHRGHDAGKIYRYFGARGICADGKEPNDIRPATRAEPDWFGVSHASRRSDFRKDFGH